MFPVVKGSSPITIFPYLYNAVIQGIWAIAINAAYYMNFNWSNTSFTNGDEINYIAFLDPGIYTVEVMHQTATNGGIVDIDIGGVAVGSLDMYANPGAANVRVTYTGINIIKGGAQLITLKLNGKNALSTSWICRFNLMTITRTD